MKFAYAAAILAGLAAPAMAQDLPAGSLTTSSITGGVVFQAGETMTLTPGETQDVVSSDWTEIGSITDVVLSTEGQMIGIVASVSGMNVYLPVESSNLVAAPGQEFAFVTDLTLEEMQGQAQAQ